jgi:luciferase family oxidoreductase group 1
MIAQAAARTRRIRVGSGGVMLTHYAPLKVAEQFAMLETLFPGRIDLGIGRAPGSDTKTARALADGPPRPGIDRYDESLIDLYGYLSGTLPPDHPFSGVRAHPVSGGMPELWLLGSSLEGAHYAATLGWRYCHAHFINPDTAEAAIRIYRKHFDPSPFLDEPVVALGVSATCAPTDEEAEYLSWSRWGWRVGAGRLPRPGVPTPEEAMAVPYTEPELDYIAFTRSRSIHGTAGHVVDRLAEIGEEYGASEFIVVTITHSHAARVRSYELLAAEAGLVVERSPAK